MAIYFSLSVLSACSSVFKTIISDPILSSPIIYLKGIQSFEIESILQFIYLGEATFYQERVNEFINVARSLDIKGISNDIEIPENYQLDNFVKKEIYNDEALVLTEAIPEHNPGKQRQLKQNYTFKYQCDQCNHKADYPSHLQLHIKSVHEGVKYPCIYCNYKATVPSNLQQHVKSVHEGVKYPCDQCSYQGCYPSALRSHKNKHH